MPPKGSIIGLAHVATTPWQGDQHWAANLALGGKRIWPTVEDSAGSASDNIVLAVELYVRWWYLKRNLLSQTSGKDRQWSEARR